MACAFKGLKLIIYYMNDILSHTSTCYHSHSYGVNKMTYSFSHNMTPPAKNKKLVIFMYKKFFLSKN